MQVHEDWWYQNEENVGDCVEELCDEWREGVVFLAPVDRRASTAEMAVPHLERNSWSIRSLRSAI